MAQQIVGVAGGMLFQISAQRQQTLVAMAVKYSPRAAARLTARLSRTSIFSPFRLRVRVPSHGRRDQGIGQPTPQRRRQGGQQEQTGQRAEHPQQIGSGAMGRDSIPSKSRRRLLKPKQDGLAMVHLAIV